ncbi:hypothetical protein Verru16b_01815 [Lacunisphaera limnophila]|uniref:Uncharacterized protein n=2 Tax=Lacunisphaera limnophila TaxID=1838286 RepID=A0A1D8AV17_9BACT|nr:hypothetical protein Verru16b_01815 [Lacunisphaera limnophila]
MVWQDNVTNAERPSDLIGAWQWHTALSTEIAHAGAGGHRWRSSAGVRTEVWPRFEGLNLVAPGVAGAWEYKPGVGPYRPVFSADGETEWIAAQEAARAGWAGALRLRMRQRLGAAWEFSAGHEWRRLDAHGMAFDRTGREWFGRLEYVPVRDWILALEAAERVGDVVSYSQPPRPDLVAIGKPITFVDTFEQSSPWIAYYFRARTRSGAVEVMRRFGRATLTLRYEFRDTVHAGPGYRNRLTAVRYAVPF